MPHGFPEIVEQHAEEAAFLWLLRDEAARAPNYSLGDLAALDERVDAHLDGLRAAGAAGWEECMRQLAWREPGEVFAATCTAIQSRVGRRLTRVLDVALQSPDLARGCIAALAWLPYEDVRATISALTGSDDHRARRIGIAAAAAHRSDPGDALVSAVTDPDPALRGRARKAAAELGRRDLLARCAELDPRAAADCRFWEAWSATVLGDGGGRAALCEIATRGGPLAERACDLATRCMTSGEADAWLRYLATTDGCGRLAVAAARAWADARVVPWLIDVMAAPDLARIAGEAVTAITGVDFAAAGLATPRPEGFESGPNDDPDDDNVAMDPDEHLPWPAPTAVGQWWSRHGARFTHGVRCLMGRPIGAETLDGVLLHGSQRQRAAAALESVLARPGTQLFEVRARAERQQRLLAHSAGHTRVGVDR